MKDRIVNGMLVALAASLVAGSAGCAWVSLDEGGENVRVAMPAEVTSCEAIGKTHSKTSGRAWIFARNPRKIDEELEFLARNEAANMGGNTIVPQAPTTKDGRRSYDVYRCGG
jgi:hypothetical protein